MSAGAQDLIQAEINYYALRKMYSHVEGIAKNALGSGKGSGPVMTLWNAYALLMLGKSAEAMRMLAGIHGNPETRVAASLALIAAHKEQADVDSDAVGQLEKVVEMERETCGEAALYQASLYAWLSGDKSNARSFVDKLCKMNKKSVSGLALRGWLEVSSGREANQMKSEKYFNEAIRIADSGEARTKVSVDALFGKATFYMVANKYEDALHTLEEVLGRFPEYVPAIVELAKVHLAMGDWEMASERADSCIMAGSANCIDARRIKLLYQLCRDGNNEEAVKALGDLIQAIDATEASNHALFFECSLAPTRLSGRHPLILQQTKALIERALDIVPRNADYICELGYHYLLSGDTSSAVKCYKKAMALDETSVKALHGIISCQLLTNHLDEAAQQLDFLNEIQASMGVSAELGFLTGLLAARRKGQAKAVFAAIEGPMKAHLQAVKETALSEKYFEALSPDLLLQAVLLYLEFGPTDPPASGDAAPPVMRKCVAILEEITRVAPGLLEAVYLLARVKFLSGDIEAAKSSAQYCLSQDNTHADALLLMASINVYQGNVSAAAQSLEIGLSYNFEVRDSPTYHLIQAKILQAEGNIEGSIKTLAKAWKLPGVKRALPAGQAPKGKRAVTAAERVSVYLELANAFSKAGQSHEAAKIMQDAAREFSGTSEEMRIQICNADLAIGRGDVEGALTLLTEVRPDNSYYVQAKEKMARIYLDFRKDKEKYAACYKELVDQNPTPHTQLLLGDAYIAIHDPENAIVVYEKALRESGSRDSVLAQKIGMALVKTHDYKKAIFYYESVVKQGGTHSMLRADLAELYLKLGEDNKCDRTLQQALEHDASSDLEVMLADVRYRMLMSRMHTQFLRPMQAINDLEKARALQTEVLRRSKIERPEMLQQQKELAADICMGMAEHHRKQGDVGKATELYSEAISYDENNAKATISLSKLYLETGQLEDAQQQLTVLLNNDKRNTDATMMMAEVMFRKHESDSAIFHFTQLLDREPEHYEALARLIDLMRRAGELPNADKFLETAKKASMSASTEPGLNYCRGLYHMYLGETNQALACFSKASKDSDFGVRALYHMVSIYLNPDDETLGGEIFEKQKRDESALENCLKSAQDALNELARRKQSGEKKYEILKNYLTMSDRRTKGNTDKAIKAFTEMVVADKDNVPAMLGVARAYMFQKQPSKARYQLKNILKMNWTSEYAEEFEGGWLLLADIHIGSGKHDLAQEPLKKAVTQNKSCSKAWEYMGHIWEKDQAYVNAVEFYEYAWTYSNQKNMGIGYKLAFNYLKAQKHVEAIDICHKVLSETKKQYGREYPKIRTSVLEKARSALRLGSKDTPSNKT